MAATSNRIAMKLLRKKWSVLHKWVYVAIGLAAVHFFLMVRSDYGWATTYSVIALILITARWIRGRTKKVSATTKNPTRNYT
jgi:DMSO/TMAO reductase YedYZ heme-binding membrane subunit